MMSETTILLNSKKRYIIKSRRRNVTIQEKEHEMQGKELTKEYISKPRFKGIVWIHSITTMLFACVPVFVSGIAGEQLTDDLYITGFNLPDYCSMALILVISPLLNATIYMYPLRLKIKLALYHIVAIMYGMVALYCITHILPELQECADYPVTIATQAIYLPITYGGNSIMINWIEFKTKQWKEKKDE